KIGALAGLGQDQIEACLQDEDKLRSLVAWYQHNAAEDGISSTPSFLINGRKYNNMSYDQMRNLLDDAAS
ncbi:MAG: thioredoxin domain-containing protein, partial [Pseudomonadota bacterium]